MKKSLLLSLFIIFLLSSCFGYANVIITGTRVIYPSNAKSITVKLTNEGESPSLVQSWIENGEVDDKKNNKKIPFLLTPPLVRIDPDNGQELRVFFTGERELSDKMEHLFWLNILDIPPKSKSPTGNQLSLAVNSKLKLFYRPSSLPAPTETEFKKVLFSFENNTFLVSNPTPYYMSLISVGDMCNNNFDGLSIKPRSKSIVCKTKHTKLAVDFSYSIIDDFGAIRKIVP